MRTAFEHWIALRYECAHCDAEGHGFALYTSETDSTAPQADVLPLGWAVIDWGQSVTFCCSGRCAAAMLRASNDHHPVCGAAP